MISNYTISQLFIYPVKGLSGIAVNNSFVTNRGLQYDRRWMLIDEHHQFISQRTFSRLCLFKLEMGNHGFIVRYNSKSIHVPFETEGGQTVRVKIWDDKVEAVLADDLTNEFFSEQLASKCRLVFMPDNSNRWVDKNFVKHHAPVSFADGYPLLIIGQESLNLLNQKLEVPVEMDRFRPNIVFQGGIAHEEDQMQEIRIGQVQLKGIKPCARCQVPTINQLTGVASKEPVKTLSGYRTFNHKINFGQNVIVLNEGKISVNDKIILES